MKLASKMLARMTDKTLQGRWKVGVNVYAILSPFSLPLSLLPPSSLSSPLSLLSLSSTNTAFIFSGHLQNIMRMDFMVSNLYWRNTKDSVKGEYQIPPLVEDLILLDFSGTSLLHLLLSPPPLSPLPSSFKIYLSLEVEKIAYQYSSEHGMSSHLLSSLLSSPLSLFSSPLFSPLFSSPLFSSLLFSLSSLITESRKERDVLPSSWDQFSDRVPLAIH